MNIPISVLLQNKGSAVHSVTPAMKVSEAVVLMNRHKVGSVLVLEGERLAGIFTERDVLRRIVGENRDPKSTPVSEVMTAELITIRRDTSINDAIDIFTSKRCRHLPVVEEGRLLGLISIGDTSRWLSDMHRAEAEHLKNYIRGGLSS